MSGIADSPSAPQAPVSPATPAPAREELQEPLGYWSLVWQQFRKKKLAFWSLVAIVFILLLAAWAPLLAHSKPFYWTSWSQDPGSGAWQAQTSYPLLRYLVAPTQELSVDYLFNYFFFLSTLGALAFWAAWRIQGRGARRPKRGPRALKASAVALVVASLPFWSPGMRARSANAQEREENPRIKARLAELKEELLKQRISPEEHARKEAAAAQVLELQILRPWDLDTYDYLEGYLTLSQELGPEHSPRALFPPIAQDPTAPTREVLQDPGQYLRYNRQNYRIIERDFLRLEDPNPNIRRVCLQATPRTASGSQFTLAEDLRLTPFRVRDPADTQWKAALQAGKACWLLGELEREERQDNPGKFKISLVVETALEAQAPVHTFWHLLGTDREGRDVLCRMLHGSRISISVGFVSVTLYVLIGIILGGIAGYFRGITDILLSRFIELIICFPSFFLILTILATVEKRSIFHVMLIIGLTSWPGIARLVRGEFLKLSNLDFVHAARALGCSSTRVMFRHILPNALGPVLVSAAFGVAGAVLTESGLSYLGFGAPPPAPTWGEMIKQGKDYIEVAWWLLYFPGFSIFFTVTVYNLVGDGLRDAMDPKMRK